MDDFFGMEELKLEYFQNAMMEVMGEYRPSLIAQESYMVCFKDRPDDIKRVKTTF